MDTTDSLVRFLARLGSVYIMANFLQFTLLLWMGFLVGALSRNSEIRERRFWGWIHKTAYYYLCAVVLAMLAVSFSADFGLEYLLVAAWAGLAFLSSAACKAVIKPGGTVVNGVPTDKDPSEEVVFAVLSVALFAAGLAFPGWFASGPLSLLDLALFNAVNGFLDLAVIGWALGIAGLVLAVYRMVRLPFLVRGVVEKILLKKNSAPAEQAEKETRVIDVDAEKLP